MELQPITQPLILTIKQWSLYCQLNENITTYALAMLAIFFMQTKKYLPSVKKLRELNPGEVRVIDGKYQSKHTKKYILMLFLRMGYYQLLCEHRGREENNRILHPRFAYIN